MKEPTKHSHFLSLTGYADKNESVRCRQQPSAYTYLRHSDNWIVEGTFSCELMYEYLWCLNMWGYVDSMYAAPRAAPQLTRRSIRRARILCSLKIRTEHSRHSSIVLAKLLYIT